MWRLVAIGCLITIGVFSFQNCSGPGAGSQSESASSQTQQISESTDPRTFLNNVLIQAQATSSNNANAHDLNIALQQLQLLLSKVQAFDTSNYSVEIQDLKKQTIQQLIAEIASVQAAIAALNVPPAPSTYQCSYKGNSYNEGETMVIPNFYQFVLDGTFVCDNRTWNIPLNSYNPGEMNPCVYAPNATVLADLGCPSLPASPGASFSTKHVQLGKSIQVYAANCLASGQTCVTATIDWGDGHSDNFPTTPTISVFPALGHVYGATGSYNVTVSIQVGMWAYPQTSVERSEIESVRVDP